MAVKDGDYTWGMPLEDMNKVRYRILTEVCPAAFGTTVIPHTRAGLVFYAAMLSRKFQGSI